MTPSKDRDAQPQAGPKFAAIDPWIVGNPNNRPHQLLSDRERSRLASISSVVRFKKGQVIYKEGEASRSLFNVISGVVATFDTDAHGHDHVAAFLHPNDLFGLAEAGRYTNSAKAVTAVTAYALSTSALRRLLASDGHLDFQFVVKLCQDLRQSQRHLFLLNHRQAVSRLALFLQMQEHIQASRGEQTSEIYLPMSRSDIAEYVGLSLAAVSRAFGALGKQRVLRFRNRHHVKVLDREAFDRIADEP